MTSQAFIALCVCVCVCVCGRRGGGLWKRKRNVPLSNNASAHDDCAGLAESVALVHLLAHVHCILQTSLTGDCIGAARVDDHRSDALSLAALKGLLADLNRCRLELVGGENSSSRAWGFGGDQCQVRELGVGGLDTNMGTGDEESLWIGSRGRDVLLLGGGNGHVQRGRVVAHLALRHSGESSHCGRGLSRRNHEYLQKPP